MIESINIIQSRSQEKATGIHRTDKELDKRSGFAQSQGQEIIQEDHSEAVSTRAQKKQHQHSNFIAHIVIMIMLILLIDYLPSTM